MRIVFFTGAGMSAESGIPTYRDSDGLWEQHDPSEVATSDALERNPQKVYDFFNAMTKRLKDYEPNAGHYAIAELSKEHTVHVITQNIDNLHERAGSQDVLHLHGDLTLMRSEPDEDGSIRFYDYDQDIKVGSLCETTKSQLRPYVVLFGEVPDNLGYAKNRIMRADVLVIVGTSLQVYPAASLVAAPKAKYVFLINPDPEENISDDFRFINKTAVEGIKEVVEFLSNLKEAEEEE